MFIKEIDSKNLSTSYSFTYLLAFIFSILISTSIFVATINIKQEHDYISFTHHLISAAFFFFFIFNYKSTLTHIKVLIQHLQKIKLKSLATSGYCILFSVAAYFLMKDIFYFNPWGDELDQFRQAIQPLKNIPYSSERIQMPPYDFYLTALGTSVFGKNIYGLRFNIFIANLFFIPILISSSYLFCKKWIPRTISVLLVSLSPIVLSFSVMSRPYILGSFFTLALLVVFSYILRFKENIKFEHLTIFIIYSTFLCFTLNIQSQIFIFCLGSFLIFSMTGRHLYFSLGGLVMLAGVCIPSLLRVKEITREISLIRKESVFLEQAFNYVFNKYNLYLMKKMYYPFFEIMCAILCITILFSFFKFEKWRLSGFDIKILCIPVVSLFLCAYATGTVTEFPFQPRFGFIYYVFLCIVLLGIFSSIDFENKYLRNTVQGISFIFLAFVLYQGIYSGGHQGAANYHWKKNNGNLFREIDSIAKDTKVFAFNLNLTRIGDYALNSFPGSFLYQFKNKENILIGNDINGVNDSDWFGYFTFIEIDPHLKMQDKIEKLIMVVQLDYLRDLNPDGMALVEKEFNLGNKKVVFNKILQERPEYILYEIDVTKNIYNDLEKFVNFFESIYGNDGVLFSLYYPIIRTALKNKDLEIAKKYLDKSSRMEFKFHTKGYIDKKDYRPIIKRWVNLLWGEYSKLI